MSVSEDAEYQLFPRYLASSGSKIRASAWKPRHHPLCGETVGATGDVVRGDDFIPNDVLSGLLSRPVAEQEWGAMRRRVLAARRPAFDGTRKKAAAAVDAAPGLLPDLKKAGAEQGGTGARDRGTVADSSTCVTPGRERSPALPGMFSFLVCGCRKDLPIVCR